jgi:two-component system, NtrC family, sensor histidine kinase AtoS
VIVSAKTCQRSVAAPEAFLGGLVQGMRCGVLAVDADERLVLLNDVARQLLDLAAPVRSGTHVEHALADHPHLVQLLRDSAVMASPPNRAEIELRTAAAEPRTIGFTVSLVRAASGERLGVAMFFKDLTQIEHTEEQERLRGRLAALGEMTANLAHEIRNPLASIGVTCELLRRQLEQAAGSGDERSLELLAKVVTEVRRLDRTVNASLEFVRPVGLDLAAASLPAVLDAAIAVAAERRPRPEVRILRRYEAAMPPFRMDAERLRQVFENLVLNALEAIRGEGAVVVQAEVRHAPPSSSVLPSFERFVVVRVSDSGPGIADPDKDRVFFPFFTTKKQGSGVGLAMAKKIVSSHGGLIDVDDAPEGGARFTVRLPMLLQAEA